MEIEYVPTPDPEDEPDATEMAPGTSNVTIVIDEWCVR